MTVYCVCGAQMLSERAVCDTCYDEWYSDAVERSAAYNAAHPTETT